MRLTDSGVMAWLLSLTQKLTQATPAAFTEYGTYDDWITILPLDRLWGLNVTPGTGDTAPLKHE